MEDEAWCKTKEQWGKDQYIGLFVGGKGIIEISRRHGYGNIVNSCSRGCEEECCPWDYKDHNRILNMSSCVDFKTTSSILPSMKIVFTFLNTCFT